MKCYNKILICLIVLSIIYCSDQNKKLVVDELFVSKHQVSPGKRANIVFYWDGKKIEKNVFEILDSCDLGNFISHSTYLPKIVFSVNSSGTLRGYFRNCPKEGFFNIRLSDSLLIYFNTQIKKINYKKLNTIYSGYGEGFNEYFISIKEGDEEKQIMVMKDYEGIKIFRSFIDSIYNYINYTELLDSINIPFRRDSLIVLKTEQYYNIKYQSE